MTFPDTVEEFMEQYKIVDREGIYMSKGSELVPIYRMEQWFEHRPDIITCKECKYSHMTVNGECKYCDIWFPDEKCYMSGDYYCGSAERREDG